MADLEKWVEQKFGKTHKNINMFDGTKREPK